MEKRNLTFWQIWNLSFGFFGVQIAYSLQNANISRIFATLGADPHDLSYFWILPPLMGLLVQPIIGVMSDRTWTRFGRRIPYLFLGAIVAVIVMCLLPNAGSLHMAVGAAMIFGLISLMLLDTSINVAMQPFKMLVGDMVNERQKGFAYSIQSFLCNAGSLVGYLCPILFTVIGIANVAPEGIVPDSVIYSFYVGAAILILCVIYTVATVKEMPPKEYAIFHNIKQEEKAEKVNLFKLLLAAPKVFWTVGIVQFFSWAAFMYMGTYTPGAIADTVWGTTNTASSAYQEAGNWVGVLFAVQAIGAVLWALVIPLFKSHRAAYIVSLAIGAVGFVSIAFISNQYLLFIPYLLIGCSWAAMLALPFTLLTNALSGSSHLGSYLGLFNGTICIPQIIAALAGGMLLKLLGGWQVNMLVLAGVLLFLGAASVAFVKKTNNE